MHARSRGHVAHAARAEGPFGFGGESGIACEQNRGPQCFGEREIQRIVRGEIVAEFLHAFTEGGVRIANEADVTHAEDGFVGARGVELAAHHERAQRTERLGLDELRGVQRLLFVPGRLLSECVQRVRLPEQHVRERRSINDYHRRSRFSRITCALDGPPYGPRRRIRSMSSGTVGVPASSRTRASR